MPIRYPVEYEINPKFVEPGWRWLTCTLKNVGSQGLTGLEIKANSVDDYGVRVLGTGGFVPELRPGEQHVYPFQVAANQSASLYVSLDGRQDGAPFHWESPSVLVSVGKEAAELLSLFAMSEPYAPVGEKVRCEASLRGLSKSQGLRLEFWVDTPEGEFEALGEVETKRLEAGEEAVYAAEFLPEEEGLYTIYAYLFDGIRRIGRQTENVYVRET